MSLSLSLNLRAHRRQQGLTGADVASQLGLHLNTISRIERGAAPSLEAALKVAAFYGVRVEEIWHAH